LVKGPRKSKEELLAESNAENKITHKEVVEEDGVMY
jgi:hypothetical protein